MVERGHSFGITAAGGAGWQLAEWMVDGEPTVDMMGVDPRRFGEYASRGFLKPRMSEKHITMCLKITIPTRKEVRGDH